MSLKTATVTVLFDFPSNSMSFTANPGTSVTPMQWDSTAAAGSGSDASTTGCLLTTRAVKGNTSAASSWTRTLSYNTMGVPTGALVTGISSSQMQYSTQITSGAAGGQTHGPVTLNDGTNIQINLSAQVTGITTNDAVGTYHTSNGTNGAFTPVASSTNATITINNTCANANTTGSSVTIRQDHLTFVITYIPICGQSTSDTELPYPPAYNPGVITNRDEQSGVQSSSPYLLNTIRPVGHSDDRGRGNNPRGYQFPISLRDGSTEMLGESALTLTPNIDTTHILRDPLITKYEKQNYDIALRAQAEQVNTNTLLPIPPAPQAPSIPIDWPNPKGPTPSIDLRSWTVNYTLLFQTAFSQLDWPNPKGPLQYNRSYELSVNLNLIGKDQTYGLGGYPNFDWPNPKGPRNDVGYKSQAEQVNTNTLLPIQTVIQPPFYQTDWPVPKGPANNLRAVADLSSSAEQELALYTAAFQFPAPLNIAARTREWPNPRGYEYSVELRTWYTQGLQNTTLAPPSGDTTHILRGPLITKFEKTPHLSTAVFSQPVPNTTSLLNSIKPVGQASSRDWGNNPRGTYYYQKEFFPLSIVIEPIPAAPFKAANWPNPVLRTHATITIKTHEHINNLASQLYVAPAPTIWRLPSVFRNWRTDSRVAENSTTLQNVINLLTLGAPQLPPASYDWPNPRGHRDNINLRTFLHRNVHTIGQDTFYGDPGEVPGFTWPQPRTFNVFTDKDIHKKSELGLFATIKPVGQYQFPARLDGKPFNERTWLVNNLQTTLNFTPNLLFFSTKSWNWQANPEKITFNVPATQKAWVWQPKSFTETFAFSFQKSWAWLGRAFGANLTFTAGQNFWNWTKNTLSLQFFMASISKSWQWRGNPATFIGNSITASARKLLMLLGVGQ